MAKSRVCACTQSSSVLNHSVLNCLISQTAKALTTSMSRPIRTYNKALEWQRVKHDLVYPDLLGLD